MTTWVHSGLAGSGNGGLAVTFADTGSIDAFGRQRVSEPFTLFDSKQIWDDGGVSNDAENYPLFYDNQQTSGAGTTTAFNANRASTILSVANTTAGTRVRQTKQYFNYQPGKSQLFITTNVVGSTPSGVTKRWGLFTGNNGLFFQDAGGTLSVVIRSFVSGSAVNNPVTQANWNLDPLNGNGPSGISLDKTKVNIWFVDFEWLGVGRVRFGVYIDGLPIYCHQFLNANHIGSVYMSNPNLPLRYEISNDGSGTASSIEAICSTVVSEGGIQPNGTSRWADIGATTALDIAAATPGTAYAICGIRLKAAYLSADVRLEKISMIETSGTNNPFLWKLHLNPTVTAGLTYSDQSNSAIQFGRGDADTASNNVITAAGTVLAGGYQARTDATANVAINTALRMGATIAGVADRLILSGTPTTNNQLYFAGMQWREAW